MSLSQWCWCLPALPTFPVCTRLSLCGAPGPLASSGPSALSALPSSRWLSWCSRPGSAPQTFAHSRRDQSHPAAHWDCLRWETVPVQSTAGSFRGFCICMYTLHLHTDGLSNSLPDHFNEHVYDMCVHVSLCVVRCAWSQTGRSQTVTVVCPLCLHCRPCSRWRCWWECLCWRCGPASSVSVSSGSAAPQQFTRSAPGCSWLQVSHVDGSLNPKH